tara:strand:- start:826 stop:996 length:171 start_codon:yes stop_codon:yes gene_type:complete
MNVRVLFSLCSAKFLSKLQSKQAHKEEEHNPTLSLQKLYLLVLTKKLVDLVLAKEF